MTRDNITIEALAKEAEPYDPSVANPGDLLEVINKFPELKIQLEEKITNEFLKKITEEGKCYFVINNVSYKYKIKREKEVRMSYCGKRKKPLISIDI